MMGDFLECDACGRTCHVDDLDAKPCLFAGLLWRLLPAGIAFWLLDYAAERGWDFGRLECSRCYGHGFEAVGGERNG